MLEVTELTLSHVGLGGLTEAAAMTLIGNAQCHRLTEGTGHSIRGIIDDAGRMVYPGYYYTRLEVPPGRLLGLHRVWDRVAVEIDLRRYGALLLASRATLSDAPAAGDPDGGEVDDGGDRVTLLACNSFYVDHAGGEKEPAAPKRGTIAALPALKEAPWAPQVQSVPRVFVDAQAGGSIDSAFAGNVPSVATVRYVPRFGYDLPWGEHIAFSQYATISAGLEREFLQSVAADPFPLAALEWCETLRRETIYCTTIASESALTARLRMRFSPAGTHPLPPGRIVAAELESVVDVRRESDDRLVLSSKSLRVFAVPAQLADLAERCCRWCAVLS